MWFCGLLVARDECDTLVTIDGFLEVNQMCGQDLHCHSFGCPTPSKNSLKTPKLENLEKNN